MMRVMLSTILMLFGMMQSFADSNKPRLQRYLENYKSLTGQFTQMISSEKSQYIQSSAGEFWIQKPNRFRWHYSTPYVQKIISNGEKLWIYDEDLEQVTIKEASQSIESSPLAVIVGATSLDTAFDVTPVDGLDNLQWLRLIPNAEANSFEFIEVGFKNGLLSKMRLKDNFGQTTYLTFTDVMVDTSIDTNRFEFAVPEGADVFNEIVEQ
ncbi:MAG: outer membrane lipoprotein carrier protein LolA [Cycloclasticus sp.]|nr:outer membrane lipoprotein carrier protein LolA [Cycloclasticus sp.]MBG96872.1 outer membrane lipoprotein carrier protein LolA [Cycloclasticus sp.]HAI96128.1 outer membrane lipoprotein carrier protein LolA [Methylococcaceae bacterium]